MDIWYEGVLLLLHVSLEAYQILFLKTRRQKKGKFPWPKATDHEIMLAHEYWHIMTRIVIGLLRNVANNLGIPSQSLISLLRAHSAQEDEDMLFRRRQMKTSGHQAKAKLLFSVGHTPGVRRRRNHKGTNSQPSLDTDWNKPVMKLFHFREVLLLTSQTWFSIH